MSDQIAAIAISLLVYGRSNSPFLAAATYAVTYVPWVFGSIVLSPLADRFSRRSVMLTCDDTNVGSYRTIESAGGALEDVIDEPGAEASGSRLRRYWITL